MGPNREGMPRRYLLALPLLAALMPALAAFPDKPLRIVLPVAPGAASDALARTLAARLAERLGQPVLVESKAGANGIIATDAVAKSPADGHTLLFSGNSIAINPYLYRKLPFDTLHDLMPVAQLAEPGPLVLVVRANLPAANAAEFLRLARAQPGGLSYGSAGQGNTLHLAGELLAQQVGVKLLHVPYKGAAPALTDLLGGQVDFMFNNLLAVKTALEQGRVRVLAQTGLLRMAALPDVPTLHEAGVPGYEFYGWFSLFAPAATPPAVLSRLRQDLAWALAQDDVRERLAAMGATPPSAATLDMAALWKSEHARYRQLLQSMQLTLDAP